MNKYLLLTFLLLPLTGFSAELIHPLDFEGTDPEKSAVVAQIQVSVKQSYSQIGMGDPSTLRMMEKEELSAFKELTQVDDRALLDSVITQYCDIGMCNYTTIRMMYNEQKKASTATLKW